MLSFFFVAISGSHNFQIYTQYLCKIDLIIISVKYDNSLTLFWYLQLSVAYNYTLHIPVQGSETKYRQIKKKIRIYGELKMIIFDLY